MQVMRATHESCFRIDVDDQFAIEDGIFEQSIRILIMREGDVFYQEKFIFAVYLYRQKSPRGKPKPN